MSHEIQVFVGPAVCLHRLCGPSWAGTLYRSPWCPEGPALLVRVLDEEDEASIDWYGPIGDDRQLTGRDQAIARAASVGGALAYIETNYFGSSGYQTAAAWVDGADAYGPTTRWRHEAAAPARPEQPPPRPGFLPRLARRLLGRGSLAASAGPPASAPLSEEPVNRALVCLGVMPSGDRDAFVAYGLGSVRRNADFAATWIALTPDGPSG